MSIDFDKLALKTWDHHGLKCAVLQAPLYGAINGYVQVPKDHPAYGKYHGYVNVNVHGGLTYSDENGWFGFDTLHLYDWWPGMMEGRFGRDRMYNDFEWDQRAVEMETEKLAEQLAYLQP